VTDSDGGAPDAKVVPFANPQQKQQRQGNHAQWNNRDATDLRAEELAIREKFGLLHDTPLHDVTRRGSPLL
jgi:hypothetical protein